MAGSDSAQISCVRFAWVSRQIFDHESADHTAAGRQHFYSLLNSINVQQSHCSKTGETSLGAQNVRNGGRNEGMKRFSFSLYAYSLNACQDWIFEHRPAPSRFHYKRNTCKKKWCVKKWASLFSHFVGSLSSHNIHWGHLKGVLGKNAAFGLRRDLGRLETNLSWTFKAFQAVSLPSRGEMRRLEQVLQLWEPPIRCLGKPEHGHKLSSLVPLPAHPFAGKNTVWIILQQNKNVFTYWFPAPVHFLWNIPGCLALSHWSKLMPPDTPHSSLLSFLSSPWPAVTITSISHFNGQLPSWAVLSAKNWKSTQRSQFAAMRGSEAVGGEEGERGKMDTELQGI